MKSNNKILIFIISLMSILSISLNIINYVMAERNAEDQLKTQFLPLSVDNIYADIQKQIVEPYLISSVMANDTFLKDWLLNYENHENNESKIQRYLSSIKNKYEIFSSFLVSDKSKSYYSHNGFIEKVNKENEQNMWYFNFKESQKSHEINLDFNDNIANSMMMFVNYKIYSDDFQLLGITGIGLKISHIHDLLKKFKEDYHLNVIFYDEYGNIVLSPHNVEFGKNISNNDNLKVFKDKIISKNSHLIEYSNEEEKFFLQTKYIKELNLYLSVEAQSSTLTKSAKEIFYFNLIISFIIIIVITSLIVFIVNKNNKKIIELAESDGLTKLMNRRSFMERFEHLFSLYRREKRSLSLVFFDIDDFKHINDTFGHNTGDEVLKYFSSIIQSHKRETDLVSRWGGEEFIILLIDCNKIEAQKVIEKLQERISNYKKLHKLVNYNITASFGITQMDQNDDCDLVISRADKAMYTSKKNGKNRITVI